MALGGRHLISSRFLPHWPRHRRRNSSPLKRLKASRRPRPDWDSTIHDLSRFKLSSAQLEAKSKSCKSSRPPGLKADCQVSKPKPLKSNENEGELKANVNGDARGEKCTNYTTIDFEQEIQQFESLKSFVSNPSLSNILVDNNFSRTPLLIVPGNEVANIQHTGRKAVPINFEDKENSQKDLCKTKLDMEDGSCTDNSVEEQGENKFLSHQPRNRKNRRHGMPKQRKLQSLKQRSSFEKERNGSRQFVAEKSIKSSNMEIKELISTPSEDLSCPGEAPHGTVGFSDGSSSQFEQIEQELQKQMQCQQELIQEIKELKDYTTKEFANLQTLVQKMIVIQESKANGSSYASSICTKQDQDAERATVQAASAHIESLNTAGIPSNGVQQDCPPKPRSIPVYLRERTSEQHNFPKRMETVDCLGAPSVLENVTGLCPTEEAKYRSNIHHTKNLLDLSDKILGNMIQEDVRQPKTRIQNSTHNEQGSHPSMKNMVDKFDKRENPLFECDQSRTRIPFSHHLIKPGQNRSEGNSDSRYPTYDSVRMVINREASTNNGIASDAKRKEKSLYFITGDDESKSAISRSVISEQKRLHTRLGRGEKERTHGSGKMSTCKTMKPVNTSQRKNIKLIEEEPDLMSQKFIDSNMFLTKPNQEIENGATVFNTRFQSTKNDILLSNAKETSIDEVPRLHLTGWARAFLEPDSLKDTHVPMKEKPGKKPTSTEKQNRNAFASSIRKGCTWAPIEPARG